MPTTPSNALPATASSIANQVAAENRFLALNLIRTEKAMDARSRTSLSFSRLLAAAFAVLVMCLVASVSLAQEAKAPRPNILLIMCDDMGFSDIGCYGGEVDTPNIDRLARNGLRFRNFYNNAKCEHTRASLLTGRWWHHVGASATVEYSAPTFGERMRDAGYRTLMVGKWHAGQTPFERGFDRYFGLTDGCCNFWNPGHARSGEPEPAKKRVRRWANDDEKFLPFTPKSKDFYTTDAFTDYALQYLNEYEAEENPFLLYVAYTAPHYPLHASEEDVAEYRGQYAKIGWDRLREKRFTKQKELGVLPPNAVLSPRDPGLPAWNDIPEADRDWWDLRMATYAAMIDRMDRNIGRILTTLEESDELDNTIICFLSDNGASEDSSDRSTVKGAMPWEVTSYLTQGRVWANASNTPYRQYKTTDYEGGTRTPMIMHWPGHTSPGTWTDAVGHLIDFMPTMLDVSGQAIPTQLPGRSLAQVVAHPENVQSRTLYWQFGKSKAIRKNDWKLIEHASSGWQLYDLSKDPTELNDLAKKRPELAEELKNDWQTWWKSKPTD